jgi:LPS export ABC transporter protein LptC
MSFGSSARKLINKPSTGHCLPNGIVFRMVQLNKKRSLYITAAFLAVVASFFVSCNDDPKNTVVLNYDSEKMPSLNTDSVTMLISDSGLIRYRMITKTWEFFGKAKDPYQRFPHGFYAEQFDTLFHVVATVKSDTAWYYTNRQLWKLKGHVVIHNIMNETFSSDEFFLDDRQKRVYTEKYVEVVSPEKGILRGKGFESLNQQMTEFKFKDVGQWEQGKTEVYINEEDENSSNTENTEEKKE